MNDVNKLTICRDNYKSKEDFEDAIKQSVLLLLNEDYVLTVKYDEKGLGIVVIEYDYSSPEFGCKYPHWLHDEEYCEFIDFKNDNDL